MFSPNAATRARAICVTGAVGLGGTVAQTPTGAGVAGGSRLDPFRDVRRGDDEHQVGQEQGEAVHAGEGDERQVTQGPHRLPTITTTSAIA
jgi:hypothetical protein